VSGSCAWRRSGGGVSDRTLPGGRVTSTRAAVPVRAKAVALVHPDALQPDAWLVRKAGLPLWPLVLIFTLMPLWWVLGVLYFVWAGFGVLLFVLLATRGHVRLPTGTAVWLIFLGIVVVSATQLTKATAMITFSLRLGYLFTAFLVGVYVYNLAREKVEWTRIANPLCMYWLAMVALGWLGVVAPKFSTPSPFQRLLPGSIASEKFITDISRLDSTEFNPLSYNPIYRPSAPYPYTNNWGTAFAFLVPFVLAYLSTIKRGKMRIALLVSLPLSLVPAFYTLNRGMFIGIGAGIIYLLAREAIKGRVRLLVPVGIFLLLMWIVTLFIPVIELITSRTESTDTNKDRFDLYVQTWDAVLRSPFIGYGQPASVDTTSASEPLGTQGMIWQVLYSHGIPALALLYLLMAIIARRLAAAVSPGGLWLSTLPVIAVVVTPFYSYIDMNMSVLFCGIGLGLAAVDGPVNRGGP
jgi:hypothetical protein